MIEILRNSIGSTPVRDPLHLWDVQICWKWWKRSELCPWRPMSAGAQQGRVTLLTGQIQEKILHSLSRQNRSVRIWYTTLTHINQNRCVLFIRTRRKRHHDRTDPQSWIRQWFLPLSLQNRSVPLQLPQPRSIELCLRSQLAGLQKKGQCGLVPTDDMPLLETHSTNPQVRERMPKQLLMCLLPRLERTRVPSPHLQDEEMLDGSPLHQR